MYRNVVDLMVAVVFGTALANVIRSIVYHIFVPLFSLILNTKEISNMTFEIRDVTFNYGKVLDTIFMFILTTLVLLFLFIKPFNQFIQKLKRIE
jgi:large conductance mechanosensitive channel